MLKVSDSSLRIRERDNIYQVISVIRFSDNKVKRSVVKEFDNYELACEFLVNRKKEIV